MKDAIAAGHCWFVHWEVVHLVYHGVINFAGYEVDECAQSAAGNDDEGEASGEESEKSVQCVNDNTVESDPRYLPLGLTLNVVKE